MQKKLYFLNEEEKNRILNLHQSRTKSQYLLSEQMYDFAGKSGDDPKTITIKSFMTSVVGQKGKITDFFQKLPTSNPDTYKVLPDTTKTSIKDWLKYPCVTNSNNVKPFLTKDNSIAFVGGGFNWFANGRKGNFTTGEVSDYYCGDDGKVKSGLGGWKKFPCVTSNPSGIDYETRQKPTENTNWIQIGKLVYGKQGKKFVDGDNKNQSDYTCETETNLKQGGVSGGGTNQVAGGNVLPQVVTPDVVKQLRTMGGLTDTAATLTQKDINDLYALFFNNLPKK
jgi:hypothetical protein